MRTRLLTILLCLCLAGCAMVPEIPETTPPPSTVTVPVTSPAETEPVTEPTTAPTETLPEHSGLYIPGIPVEDVILYFNEICLDAEIVHGGDPSRLQRWEDPIYYYINGDPTDEDLQVINGFAQWLNTIEGFPGIFETPNSAAARLDIYFTDEQGMQNILGDNFVNMDGAVTFWYENDIIYRGIICYLSDISQHTRNSVLLEEIYNGLGPVQDTELRPDSIIYSGFSEPQSLTEMDELLLRLLYHPKMQCGMTAQECEAVIRELYY